RLDRVGQPCRDLLVIAAFLGDHHAITDVAALGDFPIATAQELVDEAVEAGLLQDLGTRCSFSHPQVRHVLFNSPRRRVRQQLHLRLADGLEARGDDADAPAIAHHLARAGDLVDAPRLARWSGLAARQALAVGAWTDAAIAAEQALAASTEDLPWEERVDLHLLITEAASHDFDLSAASRHGAAAVELSRDHAAVSRWGRAVLHLARTLVTNTATTSTAVDTTQLIQDYLRDNPVADPAIRAQLLSLLSEIWGSANRIDEALDAATEARGLLTPDTDPTVATGVQVAEGLARWARLDLPEARHAYEEAIRLTADDPAAKPGQYASVRLNLVNHLAGDVERAASAAARAMTRMADTQSWAEHSLAAAAAATSALAQGRFDDVERLGAVSERSAVRSTYPWSRGIALPAVALGRALRGDGTGAREAIDALAGGTGTAAQYRLAIDAVLGDTERVARGVESRPWRAAAPVATMQTLPGLVLHAEVGASIDDGSMARAALVPLRDAHERGVVLSQGWAVLLSRLIADCHLADGEPDEAERWLAIAAEEARTRGLVVETGRVLLSQARLGAHTGATDRVDRAATASRYLDVVGALPLAAAARRLGRLDIETAGPARRAILFTDLIDSTSLNVQVGDAAFLELVQEHDAVVRSCLRRHSGVEFKHTGDGIAAWFTEPGDAVSCGVAIGQDLERVSVLHPHLPFRVRTGISVGEPLGHAGDLFGLSVVRAARLCALAADREVLVSSEVIEGSRPAGVRFHRRGLELLKGFPDPVEVYAAIALEAAGSGAL
ncbi:MAG: adenylate/guanylate cyclase domain-containing protein, partial [Acidimicrobiales bacterium]